MTFIGYLKAALILQGVASIDEVWLQEQGIKGIVFDYDGVLVAHDRITISNEIHDQVIKLYRHGYHLAVLSNNSKAKRTTYWLERHPYAPWLRPHYKKPSPEGLEIFMQNFNLKPQEVLMIDDRLWTGGLAAYRAGTKFAWLRPALRHEDDFSVKDSWFDFVRWLELSWFRLMGGR